MDRKRFLRTMAGLTLGAVGAPVVGACRRSGSSGERAAPPARLYRIGYLTPTVPNAPAAGRPPPELVAALAARGYREGESIHFEYREGGPFQFSRFASDLVQLPVDVIVVFSERATRAVMDATKTIPIIMVEAVDPVETGLVTSLNRPGGNVTGRSTLASVLAGKRLDVLQAAVPDAPRLAVLGDPGVLEVQRVLEAAQRVAAASGTALEIVEARSSSGTTVTAERIVQAFEAMSRAQVGGVLVLSSASLGLSGQVVIDQAVRVRLPALYDDRRWPAAGGLLAYTVNTADEFQRLADQIARVLEGAKPADMPVEQPSRFDLIVNLKTARAMQFTVPPALLAQATEVIG